MVWLILCPDTKKPGVAVPGLPVAKQLIYQVIINNRFLNPALPVGQYNTRG